MLAAFLYAVYWRKENICVGTHVHTGSALATIRYFAVLYGLLCYSLLCSALLFYTMLCEARLGYVMLCYAMRA